mmetsp:Transcript_30430/g.85350  ORF Transcript_30430/g.85350 Transcript_30430/m.85350 type:complete len:696 (+) Transcript_30430:566-2653(+)
MGKQHQRDDEDCGQAQADALEQLLLDDAERLPAQKVIRVRHGAPPREVVPALARLSQLVHHLDGAIRVHDEAPSHHTVHSLELGAEPGGLDALRRVGLVHPDDVAAVAGPRALEPRGQGAVVLGLAGHQAVAVHGLGGRAGQAGGLERIRPGAERRLCGGLDEVQGAELAGDAGEPRLGRVVVPAQRDNVHRLAIAAEVDVGLVEEAGGVRVVGDEIALRVLHGELRGLPRADPAEAGEEHDHDGDDRRARQHGRGGTLQELTDAAALVLRRRAEHLVGVLPALLDGRRGKLRWRRGAAGAAPGADARAAVDPPGSHAAGVERGQGREEEDLQQEQHEHGKRGVHAEGGQGGQGRGDGDGEGHEVRQGRHHDRNPSVGDRLGDALGHRERRARAVERVHDHKGVVNPDAQDHEGQDAVRRRVGELHPRGQAIARGSRQDNGERAADGQERTGLDLVAEATQVQDKVDDHDHESAVDKPHVAADHVSEGVAQGALGPSEDPEVGGVVAAGAVVVVVADRGVTAEKGQQLRLPFLGDRIGVTGLALLAAVLHEVGHHHGLCALHVRARERQPAQQALEVVLRLAVRVERGERVGVRAQGARVVVPDAEHRPDEAGLAIARHLNAQRGEVASGRRDSRDLVVQRQSTQQEGLVQDTPALGLEHHLVDPHGRGEVRRVDLLVFLCLRVLRDPQLVGTRL